MKRPIFIILIGYIIGILWGLYLKISIVFLYLIIITIYIIVKSKKFNKNKIIRYLRKIIKFKILCLIIILSFISNININQLNQKYETLYKADEEIELEVIVASNAKEKEYYYRYKVKVISPDYKNTYLYMTSQQELEYGDKLTIKGIYKQPATERNYKGFNYKEYLKTLKIYGTIRANQIEKTGTEKNILYYFNKISLKIKENIEATYNSDAMPIILGVMLGDTSQIDEGTREDFSQSSISHVLAVSGLHVSYIIYLAEGSTKKIFGERKSQIISIIILLVYMTITGFSVSVVRASIMGILMCTSFLVYRKSDTLNNISISAIIILINNPHSIFSTSFLFTYAGTIGVVFLRPVTEEMLMNIKIKHPKLQSKYREFCQKHNKIVEDIAVAISAQLITMPIIIIKYNMINLSFLVTNLLISIIIGPIVMGGFIQIIISFFSLKIGNLFAKLVQIPIIGLSLISKIGSKMPSFTVSTPDTWQIIIYYICIIIVYYIYQKVHFKQNNRIKNKLKSIKIKIKENRKKIIAICMILAITITIIKNIPHDLELYFVDVGQGDCCFIITPNNKTILIDGGGQEDFDVGKNTVVPYILDRKKTKIDYCIISHFDTDHVGGILTVMEELEIGQAIISKQAKDSENYQEFLRIAEEKNIKINFVQKGDKITFEKDLYMEVLWPQENQITDNPLNNNSIVGKIIYNKVSILFTGDIEEKAEKEIVKIYKNTNELKATILKVAHHGSKTSSIEEFINKVSPQIALIGVGAENNFGHPNSDVIQRLESIGATVYRTDQTGEICIKVTKKGKIM